MNFLREFDLALAANCLLRRQFACNVQSYFLGKKKNIINLASAEFAHSTSVNVNLSITISDPNYVDPLGPQMERPKTAAKRRDLDDEFADEELGDDLLPE